MLVSFETYTRILVCDTVREFRGQRLGTREGALEVFYGIICANTELNQYE